MPPLPICICCEDDRFKQDRVPGRGLDTGCSEPVEALEPGVILPSFASAFRFAPTIFGVTAPGRCGEDSGDSRMRVFSADRSAGLALESQELLGVAGPGVRSAGVRPLERGLQADGVACCSNGGSRGTTTLPPKRTLCVLLATSRPSRFSRVFRALLGRLSSRPPQSLVVIELFGLKVVVLPSAGALKADG